MGHLVPIQMRSQLDPKIHPGEIPKLDGKIWTSKFQAEESVRWLSKTVDNQDSFELHLAALTARDNRVKTTESSGDEGSSGLLKPGRQAKEISDLETQRNGLMGRWQNMEIKGHLEIESPFSLRWCLQSTINTVVLSGP